MTRTQKIGIGIGVGVLIIGILLALFSGSNDTPQDAGQEQNNTATQNTNEAPTPTPPAPEQPTPTNQEVNVSEQSAQAQVLRLARIVIERYGSFSNRNNFENIRSLEPFITESFVQESLRFIDDSQDQGVEEAFYGVSTTAASLELTAFTENQSAEVTVQTRRLETKSGEDNTQFNQTAVMQFENVDDTWKVNSITWQ
jgi:hypothetical protein